MWLRMYRWCAADYALHHGLKTIVCIGETLEQREAGELWSVLEEQLNAVADKLTEEDWAGVVIAYEPVSRNACCCDTTYVDPL